MERMEYKAFHTRSLQYYFLSLKQTNILKDRQTRYFRKSKKKPLLNTKRYFDKLSSHRDKKRHNKVLHRFEIFHQKRFSFFQMMKSHYYMSRVKSTKKRSVFFSYLLL